MGVTRLGWDVTVVTHSLIAGGQLSQASQALSFAAWT